MRRRVLTVWCAGAMLWPMCVLAGGPRVDVSLHTSVQAVAPGEPFDAVIQFKFPDGWHIYWKNPGDSGLAPVVQWHLPEGFSAGRLLFPVPKKYDESGIITNILEGKVMLLARITPPVDLQPGVPVRIEADVSWLVCKESCYPGQARAGITLASARQSKPADDKEQLLFRIARRRLPVSPDKARAVKLAAKASRAAVARGDTFDVTLDVTIKDGYHIQSHEPLSEFLVASDVFVSPVEGISTGEVRWPKPNIRTDKALGKVSDYAGRLSVGVGFRVAAPTASDRVTIDGLFKYQACTDAGQCYPAEGVPWSVTVASQTVRRADGAGAAGGGRPVTADADDESAGRGDKAPVVDAPSDATAAGAGQGERPDGQSVSGHAGGDALSQRIEMLGSKKGVSGWLVRRGLIGWMVMGLLGGLILNIMPCVLPVISIKVMSFVQQADEEPRRVFRLGLTFAAGIVVSFWFLAAAILGIQHFTGLTQSWGGVLFQRPVFLITMIGVVFVFALSLLGVFEVVLSSGASTRLAGAADREGFGGAFMKGVLATLLATPCTAPLLAPAISLALVSPVATTWALFTSVAIGMALPYVLLTAKPAWMKHLPKPGNWMVTFKQLMGFLLLGTAVWLLWILGKLMGADAVVWTVAFLGFLGLACWLYGKVSFTWPAGRRWLAYAGSVLIACYGGWLGYGAVWDAAPSVRHAATGGDFDPCALDWSQGIPWVPYEKGLAERLAGEGYTVYVDYTAAWCLTCQANKKIALGSARVQARLRDQSVVPIEADYTAYDVDMQADLARYGRDAVPLNIILPANKPAEPIVLPAVLLPDTILSKLEQAGPSTRCASQVATAGG